MPKVQLKIEVNDNAESEKLGDITNQVNGEGSNANVSNVSIEANDNGIYVIGAMNKNGREMLSFGEDGNLVFNIDGFLSSNGVKAGALASEQDPDMFVWGVVPASKEYHVKLTFINAKNLKEIVVYGDPIANQFPTEAIVNGITTIYSDDNRWAINLGSESTTHTIEFTKWNRADYNACLTLIKVMLRYFEIGNHTGLLDVESLSQSNAQPKEIMYGLVPSTGTARINVFDELRDLIEEGIITNNKNAVEIYVDGKKVQHHITTDSDYENNRVLTMDFENHLSFLDGVYAGRSLTDPMSAYALLSEVLGTLNYTAEQIDNMLDKEIVYGNNENGSVKSYLENITIEYPYLESATYRETLDKFCVLAQLNLLEDDNGNLKFVSARPVEIKDTEVISIPINRQFSTFSKDEFVKNKYTNPFVGYSKFIVETSLFGEIKNGSYIEDSGETSKAEFTTIWYTIINADYSNYLSTYNDETRNSLASQTVKTTRNGKEYYKTTLNFSIPKDIMLKDIEELKLGINGNKVGTNQFTYENDDPNTDIPTHITRTYRPYKVNNFNAILEIENGQSKRFKDIIIENVNKQKDYIKFDLLLPVFDGLAKIIFTMDELNEIYATSVNFQLYGTTYRYSNLNDAHLNDIEVSGNELVQEGTLYNNSKPIYKLNRDNIVTDYGRGIRTARVSVACLDYYNTKGELAIDWNKRQMFKVGDIVRVDKDNNGNSIAIYSNGEPYLWKVVGRNFRYSGVPMIDLELQEVKFNTYFFISEIAPSMVNVTYTRVASDSGASIGVIDRATTLYKGDIIKIDAVGNDVYGITEITINGESFANGGTISVQDNLSVVIKAEVKEFSTNATIGTGATLILNRISSPNANATLGDINTNDTLYYGDVIGVSWTLDSGYATDTAYLNGERIYLGDSNRVTVKSNIDIIINTKTTGYETVWEGTYDFTFENYQEGSTEATLPITLTSGGSVELTFERFTLYNTSIGSRVGDEINNVTREVPFSLSFGSYWDPAPNIIFESLNFVEGDRTRVNIYRGMGVANGENFIIDSFRLTKIRVYNG